MTTTSLPLAISASPLHTISPNVWQEISQAHDAARARTVTDPSPNTLNTPSPPAPDTPAGPSPVPPGSKDLSSSVSLDNSPVHNQIGEATPSPDLWQHWFQALAQHTLY